MEARKERARNDSRLYFIQSKINNKEKKKRRIEFEVLGTTGKIYNVTLNGDNKKWKCTCPDHMIRGYQCKHIYFIIYRVLHFTDSDDTTISMDLIETKLNADANENQKQNTNMEDECPICFDLLYAEKVNRCGTCGKDIHMVCIMKWRSISAKSRIEATCPLCRGT